MPAREVAQDRTGTAADGDEQDGHRVADRCRHASPVAIPTRAAVSAPTRVTVTYTTAVAGWRTVSTANVEKVV